MCWVEEGEGSVWGRGDASGCAPGGGGVGSACGRGGAPDCGGLGSVPGRGGAPDAGGRIPCWVGVVPRRWKGEFRTGPGHPPAACERPARRRWTVPGGPAGEWSCGRGGCVEGVRWGGCAVGWGGFGLGWVGRAPHPDSAAPRREAPRLTARRRAPHWREAPRPTSPPRRSQTPRPVSSSGAPPGPLRCVGNLRTVRVVWPGLIARPGRVRRLTSAVRPGPITCPRRVGRIRRPRPLVHPGLIARPGRIRRLASAVRPGSITCPRRISRSRNGLRWPAAAGDRADAAQESAGVRQRPAEQELHMGVGAAEFVAGPAGQRVVDGGVEPQQHLLALLRPAPRGLLRHW